MKFWVFSQSRRVYSSDVVLPASTYIEQNGTYTRCDHTLQTANKIVNGYHTYPNWKVVQKLAQRFVEGFYFDNQQQLFEEIKMINKLYENIETGKSWLSDLHGKKLDGKDFAFSIYDVNLSTFNPVKPSILFPENYYINNIKMQLV